MPTKADIREHFGLIHAEPAHVRDEIVHKRTENHPAEGTDQLWRRGSAGDLRNGEDQRADEIRCETRHIRNEHLARAQCLQMMREQEMRQLVREHTSESDRLFLCRNGRRGVRDGWWRALRRRAKQGPEPARRLFWGGWCIIHSGRRWRRPKDLLKQPGIHDDPSRPVAAPSHTQRIALIILQ